METSHLWIFLAFFVAHSSAAPAGNVTIKTYGSTPGLQATFASEPRGRGTVGILITCTATFFFCIWTAIHPNIVPGVSSQKRFYYKAVLMVISIMIPEGVLVCAFGQWLEAIRLQRKWKKYLPDEKKLSLQVAFFVVMGGFVVGEAIDPGDVEYPKSETLKKIWKFLTCRGREEKPETEQRPYRAILTPTGFVKYLKQGYIHGKTFNQASIKDKGKASVFAKSLAMIQALYMVVGCASRWYSGLPLTLLEIHVLIQVVRTALIYSFWWCKPLDVNEPITIELKKATPVPRKAVPEKDLTLVYQRSMDSTLQVTPVQKISGIESSPQQQTSNIRPGPGVPEDAEPAFLHPLDTVDKLDSEKKNSERYDPNEREFVTRQSPRRFVAFHSLALYDIVVQLDVGERKHRVGLHQESLGAVNNGPGTTKNSNGATDGTTRETHGGAKPKTEHKALFVEAVLVCLTGALHAAAWNSSFPTTAEMWLWRGSSLAMCCCCLGVFLIANFTEYEQDLIASIWKFNLEDPKLRKALGMICDEVHIICKNYAEKYCRDHPGAGRGTRRGVYCLHQIGIGTVFFFVIVYFFSVLYITLEAYLSLRTPVPGTFLTPAWTDYWPHL